MRIRTNRVLLSLLVMGLVTVGAVTGAFAASSGPAANGDASALKIVHKALGAEATNYVGDGKLVTVNPGGVRSIVTCTPPGTAVDQIMKQSTVTVFSTKTHEITTDNLSHFFKEMSQYIEIHLKENDPDLRYAAKTRVKQTEPRTIAGYESTGYRVEYSDYEKKRPWSLLQKMWASRKVADQLRQTGCYVPMALLLNLQMLQAAPSKQLFYGVAESPDIGKVLMQSMPLRIEYYDTQSETPKIRATFAVTQISQESVPQQLFQVPAGYDRVDSPFDLLF